MNKTNLITFGFLIVGILLLISIASAQVSLNNINTKETTDLTLKIYEDSKTDEITKYEIINKERKNISIWDMIKEIKSYEEELKK